VYPLSNKKHSFILFNDMLVCVESNSTKFKCLFKLALSQYFEVMDLDDDIKEKTKNKFALCSPVRSFLLCTPERAQKQRWLNALFEIRERVMVGVRASLGLPPDVNPCVFLAPILKPLENQKACVSCSRTFGLTRKKQICYHCGHAACGDCAESRFHFLPSAHVIVGTSLEAEDSAETDVIPASEPSLSLQSQGSPPSPTFSAVRSSTPPPSPIVSSSDASFPVCDACIDVIRGSLILFVFYLTAMHV
jgi:hypothetical protein